MRTRLLTIVPWRFGVENKFPLEWRLMLLYRGLRALGVGLRGSAQALQGRMSSATSVACHEFGRKSDSSLHLLPALPGAPPRAHSLRTPVSVSGSHPHPLSDRVEMFSGFHFIGGKKKTQNNRLRSNLFQISFSNKSNLF